MKSKTYWQNLSVTMLLALACSNVRANPAPTAMDDYEAGRYAQAASKWQKQVKSNDAFAQFGLGVLYLNGQGVPKNIYTAEKLLVKAARAEGQAGQIQAMGVLLGEYLDEQNIPENSEQAIYWAERLQNIYGLSDEQNQQLAVLYIDRGKRMDIEGAIGILLQSEQTQASYFNEYWLSRGYFQLGQIDVAKKWFETFLSNPDIPDSAWSYRLFRNQLYDANEIKAQEQSEAQLQDKTIEQLTLKAAAHPDLLKDQEWYQLGEYQYKNNPDEALGIQTLKRASEKGSADASYALAQIYNLKARCARTECPELFPNQHAMGVGVANVPNDAPSAQENSAAIDATHAAINATEQALARTTQHATLPREFPEFLPAEVMTDDNMGQNVLLNAHSLEFATMLGYLQHAAEREHPQAMYDYAQLMFDGFGMAKNEANAHKMLLSAAQLENSEAIQDLAMRYLKGNGVPKNIAKGLEWYEMYARDGVSAQAPIIIAGYYCKGDGIPQNLAQCKKYLNDYYNVGYDSESALHFIQEDGLGAYIYLIDK